MIVSILTVMVGLSALVVVWLVSVNVRLQQRLSKAEWKLDAYTAAVDMARGHLISLTSTSIPGASDAAIRVLNDIDERLERTK